MANITRQRVFATLRSLLPPVSLSMVLAVAGLGIVRHFVPEPLFFPDSDAVGNYLQTVGTIYAVLLAFVVFVVWNQFDQARGFVEQEANELLDLCRMARGFPQPVCSQIYAFAQDYLKVVLDAEWSAMATDDEPGLEKGWGLMDRISDQFHAFEPKTGMQEALCGVILARLNGLCDSRTNRLSSSRLRIPLALRILLYSGAATIIGSMYLLAFRDVIIHVITTAALAGAIAHVIFVIEDLDDCFAGDWRVPRAPFRRVEHYLSRLESGAPCEKKNNN